MDRQGHPAHRADRRARAADLLRRAAGLRADQYSIVGAPAGSPPIELDTPGGGEGGNPKTFTYTGKGGVAIGSLWHRVLYAAKFADVNLLLSDRVNPESKIIYDRTPRERVQKAAPWLKVDGDAYPAVVEGRIVWIVDGYTTSNSYPNSERVNLNQVTSDAQTSVGGTVVAQPQDNINYMRNSVKAVVDAYDGTVKLYGWDETDPVLQDLDARPSPTSCCRRPRSRPTCWTTCATRRTCSRCSGRSWPATT